MSVEFRDYSINVNEALNDAAISYLYEAAGEIEAQVKSNTRTGTGQLKNSWTYIVDEDEMIATVGSPLQNALWEEFGTGEFALNGDGRKGYWVYVKDSSSGNTSKSQRQYTLEEAKQTVAYLQSQGLDASYTKGKKPHRALQRAFTGLQSTLINMAKEKLKEGLNNDR